MGITSLRSLLLAAIVLSNCFTWTVSRHHYAHNINGHRSRHRRQGANLFLPGSYVIPGGEGSGPWGEWLDVSPCSRTCGGGVASQKRICLTKGSDGPPCVGGDTKYFSCHTQDCPEGSLDFRAEQCAEYNDVVFRDNNKYSWIPYTRAPNPCELNCMPRGERFYYRHRSKVVDGTRCNDESFDVCVDGICQPVGCDMMLGSNAREDKCRECRGNGTNCRTMEGIIDDPDLRRGYNDVLLIPQGATNIIIEEIKESSNYLALRAKEHTKYYLNGNYQIDFPRSLIIAGTLWHYERSQQGFAAPDKLRCVGPTNEPLYLSLLLQEENVGVKYEYSIPSDIVPRPTLRYDWVFDKFTSCSASCGGGFQMRKVTCRSRDELEEVDESLCDEGLKPATNQTCNTQPCEPRWVEGPWSPCSKSCGEGGNRSRKVRCEKIVTNGLTFRSSIEVSDKECFDLLGAKPKLYEECNQNASCPTWFTGPWKACDKLCGEGKQTRQVVCHTKVNGKVEVFDDEECTDKKPSSEQPCNLHPCGGIDWVLSDWSGCDTCLSTTRTRMAKCATADRQIVDFELCSYHPVPTVEEPCDKSKLPSCEFQWYATQWSNCSVECGKGVQTRQVFCGMFDGTSVTKVDDDKCDLEEKYKDSKPCEVPKEKCIAKWFTGPWTECTKECGGGEQSRQVMCLIGEETGKCDQDTIPDTLQTCNMGPCNEDEMLPVDSKSTPIMDDYYDYEDCDDETYDEVGAEVDTDISENEQMFSDSPSFDANQEFNFVTDIEEFGSGDESTDMSTIEGSGETNWMTTWETTESTFSTTSTIESSESDSTSGTESSTTETSITGSTELDTTETTETGITETTEIFSTSETGSTKSSDETDSTKSSEIGSTETVPTDGTESTVTDVTNATEISSTEPSETSGTETSETVSAESSTTETSELTSTQESSETPTTVSSNLDSTESITTVSEFTDTDGTTSTELSSTESTETSTLDTSTVEFSTTSDESTISTDSTTELSTETTSTTDSSTSETPSEKETSTTETSITESSSQTEISSTESISESTSESTTESTGTDITSASTESSTSERSTEESTASQSEGTSVTTEGTTEFSTTAESTTEVVSTTMAETEITLSTESGSTGTETTESISSSTQEATSSETVSGSTQESTEPTDTTESTETSISESVETTESSSTEGTDTTFTGLSTTEMSTEGTTLGFSTSQSWASTIEGIVKKPKCKRKKIAKCLRSKYGCCPDHRTPAAGPFDKGCPTPKTCKDTKFGCCDDGVSPAAGPNEKGCPVINCNETLYGCCLSDKITPAEGNNQEGCPKPVPACEKSKYGCCKDRKTMAKGLKKEGCPETQTQKPDTKPKGCVTSVFGCCADNTTEATGPDGAGCPCNITKFGCCPDGVSPAGGTEMEGCVMSCNTTEYGCCQDGQTPAHGPDFKGCCLLTAFGCCPDNYKAAEGPHLEGCGCEYARYGCCPDNVTIARGPNNEGCDCKYSQYGCCPDRHTEAKGPNFKGCDCNTYQFGCCPDGYTAAKGPSLQGCYCQQTQYGCCGDGITAAQGPDQFGCNCASSKFGCCPDGVTEAKGTKFLNCTDVPQNRQAACALAADRGPCRNYTVNWFYDMTYGGCSRFWYGGCEGNGNRFNSKEECEDICVQPAPKDACKLPKVRGACNNRQIRWYYDSTREQCSQFEFGGCLGNANNYESRELCQKQCEPDKVEDQCNLPIERGSCAGNFGRWGFNPKTGGCEQFIWGGCEGNSNRFNYEAACLLRCNPPGVQKPECSLPQESGNCTEKLPLWSFSVVENRCLPFYYTGCGGNDNRFDSEATCMENCPSAYVQETCAMPALTGDCANYTLRWFFDTSESRCRQFYYGGCGGNNNNFMTEEQCKSSCVEQELTTKVPPAKPKDQLPEVCFLETVQGPCNNYQTRWAYDSIRGDCVPFEYGGCGGNQNNFQEQSTCQNYCTPAQGLCQLPVLGGPCDNYTLLWFYDTATDLCQQFYYGGCEGNDNRFESQEACERRCRKVKMPTPNAVTTTTSTTITTTTISTTVAAPQGPRIPPGCQLVSSSLEECVQPGQVWYLDVSQGVCVAHENAPSGTSCRRTGTYGSQEACERACGAFAGINVCRYSVDPGPCNEAQAKVYYNEAAGRCEPFVYGGCHGGPNRFSTVEECEQVCKPETNPCKQHVEPGNCVEYYIMWYYDELRDDCGQFVYTGCSGNDNRFETREDCINRCKDHDTTTIRAIGTTTTTTAVPTPPPAPGRGEECRTPVSLDPCGENVTTYYYDTRTGACVHGDFGACGYANSYRSEEECERQCGAFRGLGVEVCRAPLDPGPCIFSEPKVYWDASTGRCLPFAYGGCHGGPNRFSSVEECQEVCGDIGPEAACLEEVDSGRAGCGLPVRRFHYDATTASCRSFVFLGCGGNGNNFPSYDNCVQRCLAGSAGSPDNNIRPECDRFNEECARLRCDYQMERVQTEFGCERCVCVPAPVDCEPYRLECQNLRCRYVQRTLDANRCERCRCLDDPCANVSCSAGERCVSTLYENPATSESEYLAECRSVNKSGSCPEVQDGEDARGECRRECYDDADCVGSGKCCALGCRALCLNPAATTLRPTTTYQPGNIDNEILPSCDRFTEECARLRCAYKMERVQTEYGCERCVCIPAPVNCEPYRLECQNMQCSNIQRTVDAQGCERCRCLDDPCAGLICIAGERCEATLYQNPSTHEIGYLTECRAVNKSGLCPAATEVEEARGGRCDRECYDDASCIGSGKCCPHSCGSVCLPPATTTTTSRPTTTYLPDVPQAPIANIDTEEEVNVGEGGKATLRCLFHGNPPPSITWRRGELTIESDIDRYRLLSDGALEIVSIYRNDSGVYICVANNALGTATQEVRLQVNDPESGSAGIAGVPNAVVTGEMGRPLNIRCLAYGFPPPSIYWYRGRNGTMVPYSSSLYEARGNILQIRSLTYETSGEYLCQAYNGIGKPAEWTVNVQIYRPERNTEYPSYVSRGPNVERESTTTTTSAPEIDYPIFSVPVTTRINADRTTVQAGTEINIPCEVDGYPLPEVYWTKDSVRLVPTNRMILTDARLTISGANNNDSGVYGCHASNPYSSHTSTVQITVEGLYIPAKCTDNPFFANCNLIVRSKFCKHHYYSRFCCKSCVEAGQLNPLELDMQADEAWRKKK